jgi:UDP-N-acetylglucosamine--N-acetylmuramyl-(pentapeptide) pyrophosphoryl-undecaprenol N-acetylglucosamine transferase
MLVKEFFKDMYQYSAAADIVITRASATALAELAMQGKPVIVIPNPNLTGGHQLINGEEILKNNAGIVLPEPEVIKNPEILLTSIFRLLDNKKLSKELSDNISKLAVSDAAIQTAKILLKLE